MAPGVTVLALNYPRALARHAHVQVKGAAALVIWRPGCLWQVDAGRSTEARGRH